MASDTGSTALEQRGLAPVTLVLICRGLERTMPGLRLDEVACRLSQRLEGVSMRVEEGLCHRPRVVKEALAGTHPQRLVLGLCSSDYPQAEVQAHARAADLNPLGIQAVDLASCSAGETAGPKAFACAVAVLTAAVARARAFPGSQPENTKTLLLTSRHKVSRRALFTLPPVSYLPVPTIDRGQCTTGEGCDQCVGACPSGALEKDGDAILVNRAACLSCGVCVAACPQRAVEFPGSSPAELEAQLSALLQADVEPKAVLFLCQHAPATPGPGWLTVRIPCTAAVPVAAILQALARGATAVGLSPCSDSCPTGQDDAVRGRVDYCRELLRLLGDSPQRVQLLGLDGGRLEPAPQLPPLPGEAPQGSIDLFGRGTAAEAVVALASRYGAKELSLEHAGSPLGIVRVDPQACTGCGGCAVACPTSALSYRQIGDGVALAFDPRLCTSCGQCVAFCPETAAGAIAVTPATDLGRLRGETEIAFQDRQARCQRCGGPIATLRVLERIASILGDAYNPQLMERLCAECRGTPPPRL